MRTGVRQVTYSFFPPEIYGKWYIFREFIRDYPYNNIEINYLHPDGSWQLSVINLDTNEYTGYYDNKEDAENILKKFSKEINYNDKKNIL